MKKFVYLCGMMLLSLNIMAQIDLNDRNWDTIVNDDFTTPRRFWYSWSFKSNITGPFQVDSGGEMTVIMQSCPDSE